MTGRRPRRRTGESAERRPSAERRRQLLEAASVVIRRYGLAYLTMERVATEAGVSKPVVYGQFSNRGTLLVAMLEEFWTEIDANFVDVKSKTLDEFNELLVRAYFQSLAHGGPALQEILSAGSEEPEVNEARLARFRQVEKLWSARYESALGLPHHTADIAAAIMRSALAGAGTYWMANRAAEEDCVAICLSVLRGGLDQLQSESGTRRRRG